MKLARPQTLLAVLCAAFLGGCTMPKPVPDFDAQWDYGNPAETEERFREILPEVRATGNEDAILQLETQIARTLGLQKKFQAAHARLDEIEPRLTAETPTARVRYLLERGRTFNSSGEKDAARKLFLEAWKFGREAGLDRFAVDAAHMMAFVEPPAAQLEWNNRAMELAEASEDHRSRRWLGTLYNNIGWAHFDLEDYERALEIHQKGLAWHQAQDRENDAPHPRLGTRIAKWSVAKLLRYLDRVPEALALHEELLEEWRAAGEEGGFVYEELGECHLAQGNHEEARQWFRRAVPLLAEIDWVAEDTARIERLKALAR